MSRRNLLVGLILCVVGCGGEREIGDRYRAERDLWHANREVSRISIRPDLVSDAERQALLARYEDIEARYSSVPVRDDSTAAGAASREVHGIVARAVLSAAYIKGALGDSAGMFENYARLKKDFSDLPFAQSEVSFAEGRLAEQRGEWQQAADYYQQVVDLVKPDQTSAGFAGGVLTLPVQIVRLRLLASGDSSFAAAAPLLRQARRYYQGVLDSNPGKLTALDARWRMAEVIADLRDWDTAIREMRQVEADLETFDSPPRDGGSIRFAISVFQGRSGAPQSEVDGTLRSIPEDYPGSPVAPRALLTMAAGAAGAGRIEDALGLLDETEDKYSHHATVCSEAMLYRARLLEQNGRWVEALTTLNSLTGQYPMTAAGLQAPIEIVAHYSRQEETASMEAALDDAEATYRGFLTRYPNNEWTPTAREKLVQVLGHQRRYREMVTELVDLGESIQNTPRGAGYFLNAAQLAFTELADTTRATEILDRVGTLYADADLGKWAVDEARRLRELQQK